MKEITRRSFLKVAGTSAVGATLVACNTPADETTSAEQSSSTASSEVASEAKTGTATIVLRGGTVHTMDTSHSTATAVALEDEKIVYVGDDAGVEAFVGEQTQIVELDGKMVLPGFIDSHIHPASGWVTDMYQCNLFDVEATEEAYLATIKEFAAANPDLPVIIGARFQINAFGEATPTKEMLDAIVSDRPVYISDTSGHAFWVNSKTLEICEIDESTPEPEGSKIYYNEDGSISGFFADAFIFDAVLSLSATTIEQFEAAWMNWQTEANSFGITAFSSGGTVGTLGTGDSYQEWEMVDKLYKAGTLTVRGNMPFMAIPDDASDETIDMILKNLEDGQKFASDYLTIRTVKALVDGVVEGRTGYLLEPYADPADAGPDYRGIPIWTQENLDKITQKLDEKGYVLHMHTIADGSTRMGVDAIEKAVTANGTEKARHVLTHLTIVDPAELPRMQQLNIIAAMQPTWFYRDPFFSQLEEQMLGTERFNRMYQIKDMIDAGVIMTGSADYNVLPDYRPLSGIETGVTQCSPYAGEDTDPTYIRNAEQAVSLETILDAYTINGAYQMGMEDKIGSLEVGKLADIVVLEKNLYDIELKDIAEVKVMKTIIGGKVVFEV